jgi:hypothetical protein
MRACCIVVAVVMMILVGASAADPYPHVVRSVGCYEVALGEWSPSLELGPDQAYLVPPKAIELTADLLLSPGVMDQWLIVRPMPGSTLGVHRWAYWEVPKDDLVVIVFTNGHSGIGMTLKYDTEEMRGTAWTFWDFPRRHQTAPAIIRRVDCASGRSNSLMNLTVRAVTALAYNSAEQWCGLRPHTGRTGTAPGLRPGPRQPARRLSAR